MPFHRLSIFTFPTLHLLFPILSGVFAGSVAVSAFYNLYFFRRLIAYGNSMFKKAQTPRSGWPGVSVVVCAHNELANLKKLVPALLQQDYPHFEVIVVDDRSDDGGHAFLVSQSLAHPQLRLVRVNETPGHAAAKKHALTLGIRAASHGIILLTDADCLPASSHWIAGMATRLDAQKQLVLGYSPYRFRGGLLNFLIRHETFYTAIQYMSFAVAGLPYMGVGRNLCYRKSLFVENGGFDSHSDTVGGDDDLFVGEVATRHNTAICLEKPTFMVSEPKETWRAWLRQKRRHLAAGKKYRPRHQYLLGVLSFSQILFWLAGAILLANLAFVPWVVAGFLVRMSLQTFILRKISGRFNHRARWFDWCAFDLLYTLYYVPVGAWALFTKRIPWK